MATPTPIPPREFLGSSFLEAQIMYESLGSLDLDSSIATLDTALSNYSKDQSQANQLAVESAFAPIAQYYSKLISINEILRNYVNSTAKNMADSDPRLINEERYSNRVHPEESVMPREVSRGLIPELRVTHLPYIISVSVFMATLSIFLIFQMNGFSGQINLPPSIATWIASPASTVPFYKNPMVLGGIVILLLTALVIFIGLYFQAKNTNNSRQ
jgi:hypothetical protein